MCIKEQKKRSTLGKRERERQIERDIYIGREMESEGRERERKGERRTGREGRLREGEGQRERKGARKGEREKEKERRSCKGSRTLFDKNYNILLFICYHCIQLEIDNIDVSDLKLNHRLWSKRCPTPRSQREKSSKRERNRVSEMGIMYNDAENNRVKHDERYDKVSLCSIDLVKKSVQNKKK